MHLIKTLTAFTLVMSFTCSCAYSQRDTTHNKVAFIAKADILLPVMGLFEDHGYFSLTFEVGFKNRHSVQFTGLISNYNRVDKGFGYIPDFGKRKENILQLIPEYKYFISEKKKYTGFYSGVYFKLEYHSLVDEVILDYSPGYYYLKYEERNFGGGIIFGYQNYFKKRWVMDVLIGVGVRTRISRDIIEVINVQFGPDNPTTADGRGAINIGYRF